MSTVIVTLSKPAKVHDTEVTQLELTIPSGEEIMEIGMPFLIHSGGAIELRPKIVGDYVVRMGKVPRPTVKALPPEDLMACQAAVLGFFGRSVDEAKPS